MTEDDDQAQGSGNRWEPAGDAPPETAPAAPPTRPARVTRARAGVAGGAAAVLLAGGLGGFAIGRATADAGDGGRTVQQRVPTGFDRDGDGLGDGYGDGGIPGGVPGGVPGGGGPRGPQLGQLPDGGQVPGMPGQDDGQQDDDETDGSNT